MLTLQYSSHMMWRTLEKTLIGKDPDAGKDWKQKEKRVTVDEMLDIITDSMDINLSKLLKMVEDKGG